MSTESQLLLFTAASIGFVHTLLGPDHYLPFIVMSRALRWNAARTFWITLLCGLGHVLSSVVLGLLGAALGIAVERLTGIESLRGGLAAWALIAFGLVYTVYGLRLTWRGKQHAHPHTHDGDTFHAHRHAHTNEHVHVHGAREAPEVVLEGQRVNLTPWILFTIFVFGPCEPLIPVIMYPALQASWLLMLLVAAVFALATIGTMLVVVLALSKGFSLVPFGRLERYSHALAGLAILASGLAIRFLGL